jgi:signal peptidase II
MKADARSLRAALVLTGLVIGADQLTKSVSADAAALGPIDPVTNADLALGVAHFGLPVVVALSVAGIVAVGGWAFRAAALGRLAAWVPAALVGGAASNLFDRLAFGAVRDFLVLPLIVANLADLAIVAGLAGLAFARRRDQIPVLNA